ncbi:UNC93-like protein [Uranotaenia lowii]|uniref:UNC93-like protein n=1 Tax=Uranotaenia lowii TaxID=190385 RepID=UPI0024790B6D|nr:UNC93-like protein [Uranotaenia lowii]
MKNVKDVRKQPPQTATGSGRFDPDIADSISLRSKVKLSKKESLRIIKNVATVSCAFMVQFTAFQGTANLQSSINAKDFLGTISLATIFASLVVSCVFLPTLIIRKLTVKWTLCLSMLCYAPYIAAQFHPTFYTLIPAGILAGLGAAPMWASQATYLTQLGQVYAKVTGKSVEVIVVRFFGFFFLAWQAADLWGNLISSLVLSSRAREGGASEHSENDTINDYDQCGANFSPVAPTDNANLARPPDSEIYIISAIYLACIVAAVVIIALFMDPLSRYGEKRCGSVSALEVSVIQLLSATFEQFKKLKQQLLILITIFIGMEQAFIGAEFTQAFVSCALGVHQIGYVMICFGVVNGLCSIVFGFLMQYTGRIPLIVSGALVHGGVIMFCVFWKPHPNEVMIFYGIAGIWGVADAVWQTQVNGLYGVVFRRNKEAAFSNYRLWESAGFAIAYTYSPALHAWIKLYLLLAVLAVGMVGYTIFEIRHAAKERRLKKLEEKLLRTEAERKEIEEDDAKDELEEDIEVTQT